MFNLKGFILKTINYSLRFSGYRLSRTHVGYINAKRTTREAKQIGLSVTEYVESLWQQQGATDRVIQHMLHAGALSNCANVCEIGPGTGRYLERVMKQVRPDRYEIYETASDWSSWLARSYNVTIMSADGHSLKDTPANSCGLVHAHGVFAVLPFFHVFEYFKEMIRAVSQNGFIVFDYLAAERFDPETVERYLKSRDHWSVIPTKLVLSYFLTHGSELVHEFDNPHACGFSHYLIFRKTN